MQDVATGIRRHGTIAVQKDELALLRSVNDSSARPPRSCSASHSGLFVAISSSDVHPAVCVRCMSRLPKDGRPNYTSARIG